APSRQVPPAPPVAAARGCPRPRGPGSAGPGTPPPAGGRPPDQPDGPGGGGRSCSHSRRRYRGADAAPGGADRPPPARSTPAPGRHYNPPVPPSDPVGSGSLGRLARSGAVFVALLSLAALIRIGIALNIALDPDESEHLHAAWLVASGWVPFRDFWDHHAPLFFYLMAPVARWSTGDVDVYLAARVAMALTGAASLLVVYRLGRRFSETAARAAVLVLAFMPRFVEKTVEVRPDAPALVAWLAVILGLVRWREERHPRWLWLSRLMLRAAMALNLKAVYGAGGILVVVAMGKRGPDRRPRVAAAALARLVAGAAVVPVAVVAWLAITGGVLGLAGAGREILTNLHFPDFVRERPVADSAFGVVALALVGLGVVVRREGRRLLDHPVHVPLLVPATVVALVLLLPTTPL